jgi:hypothetical protein
MIAVAARFYNRYIARCHDGRPVLSQDIPPQLADLAEDHLGWTLLRKDIDLFDMQAVLLLAAWGLQSGGRGPDAWVVTGHAARLARRLGIHLTLQRAAEAARRLPPDSDDYKKLERLTPKWRAWLGWFW